MAAQRVDIAIIGDDAGAHAMLNAFSTAFTAARMSEFATDKIIPWLEKRAMGRFANEGDDAVRGKWNPLMTRTNDIREQMGYPREHPINKRSGELEDFIVRGGGDVVAADDALHVQFPRNPPTEELFQKLATAQVGRADPRTLARPVVGLSPTDLSYVLTELALHVTETVHGATGAGVSLTA